MQRQQQKNPSQKRRQNITHPHSYIKEERVSAGPGPRQHIEAVAAIKRRDGVKGWNGIPRHGEEQVYLLSAIV